jgi:hypothetical protein
MKDYYQIKEVQELVNYLQKQGRDAFNDCDYQLQTNYGFVHELKNGQVVFFDNHFNEKAILFETKKCFDDIIKKDQFPVDNPDKEMFEVEGDRMKTFHLQADHYRQHLNGVLKFDFSEITKEAAQAYLKKVIGRFIKKLTTPTDIVALISVIGELVKQETNGKWFLEKRYGIYNPIYEPNIVAGNGNVILMSSKIIGQIKWRVSSLDRIFVDVHSKLTKPIKWKEYLRGRDNLIILE